MNQGMSAGCADIPWFSLWGGTVFRIALPLGRIETEVSRR